MSELPTKMGAMKVGTALAPIRPTNFDEVARLAKLAVVSGLLKPQKLKKSYGGDENQDGGDGFEDADAVLARGTMIILQGLEIGVPPMQALQLMALINGRIVLHSEGVPAVLWSHGFKIEQTWEGTIADGTRKATTKITRPGGEVIARSFSVDDAKRARLWSPEEKVRRKGKNGFYEIENDSPWHRFPDRMLGARSLGFCVKDGASDATRGLMVREEMEDLIRAQAALDITPEPQKVAAVKPAPQADIPWDMDEPQHIEPASQEAASEPDAIVDVEGYLAKLESDRQLCDSAEDLEALWANNEGLIARLPKAAQKRAAKILEDE